VNQEEHKKTKHWWRWNSGRQDTDYMVWPIWMFRIFDGYILKYGPGAYIPNHRDTVNPGYAHYRINFIFWGLNSGGEFKSESMIFETARIKFFRPDINTHSVGVVHKLRLVLSIGWLKKIA